MFNSNELSHLAPSLKHHSPSVTPRVRLKRTFNQTDLQGKCFRFWQVVSPANHPNIGSDLSVDGLKQWGIL